MTGHCNLPRLIMKISTEKLSHLMMWFSTEDQIILMSSPMLNIQNMTGQISGQKENRLLYSPQCYAVLVTYCHVTSNPKTQGVETTNIYSFTQILWLRSLGVAFYKWLKGTPEVAAQLSARAVVSSEGVSTSELLHLSLGQPQKIHLQNWSSPHRTLTYNSGLH